MRIKRPILLALFFVFLGICFFQIPNFSASFTSAHAEIDYNLTLFQQDSCNKVHISMGESIIGASQCVQGTPSTVGSYGTTINIDSLDGAVHTFNYILYRNNCPQGFTIPCTQHLISNVANNATTPLAVSIALQSPAAGYFCGTYQDDFVITSIDGNSACHYGDPNSTGAGSSAPGSAAFCATYTTCPGTATKPNPNNDISGNLYIDTNKNGHKDAGEPLYTRGTNVLTFTGPTNFTTTTGDGTYFTNSNLPPGTYTVSLSSVPGGYYLTYPLNGTPPTFSVTIGNGTCNTNGSNDATCNAQGSINNLDFGITNANPWLQSVCGDVRQDAGIVNRIPAAPSCGGYTGSYMIQTKANTCTSPGIAFSGTNNPDFGSAGGQASINPYNWTVGNTINPTTLKINTPVHTSYAYLLAKMRQSGLTAVDLSTKCTLSNCTLPANLPHGLYQANGNVVLQGNTTFLAAQDYVFLINGTITLMGNVSIPIGSTVLFSASGNIIVDKGVGSPATTITSNLDGFYSSDKSFVINSTGTCPDLRLNVAGSIITNAGLTGGALVNNRDLCANDTQCPTISITQRPDFLINSPLFLTYANHIWQEIPASIAVTAAPTPTNGPTATPTVTLAPTQTPTPTQPPYFAQDTFQRANNSNGWGTASDGQAWTADATNGSFFSISGNAGKETAGSGITYTGILGGTTLNAEVLLSGSSSLYSGSGNFGPVIRYTDTNNWYKAYIDGTTFYISKKVAGTQTNLATTSFTANTGTSYSIRFQVIGNALKARVWQTNQTEPSTWTLSTTDSSLSTAKNVGIRIFTNSSATVLITNFTARAL